MGESVQDSDDWLYPLHMYPGPSSPTTDIEEAVPGFDDEPGSNEPELLAPVRHFVTWAFGPEGIPSPQVIACQDYSHGGRVTRPSLLCRSEEEGKPFRVLSNDEPLAKEFPE